MMGAMIRTHLSAEQWKQILREQQVSGLSVAAFCRRARVPPASFYFWRKKLRRDRRRPGMSRPRRWAGRFVELKVSADSARRPATPRAAGGLVLCLPGGRRVRVRPGFDLQTLRDLVAALESCPPTVRPREAEA